MDIASYATLQLYQGTVVSNLMNHEKKPKNIGGKFHQQDKLPSKLLRLLEAKVMH